MLAWGSVCIGHSILKQCYYVITIASEFEYVFHSKDIVLLQVLLHLQGLENNTPEEYIKEMKFFSKRRNCSKVEMYTRAGSRTEVIWKLKTTNHFACLTLSPPRHPKKTGLRYTCWYLDMLHKFGVIESSGSVLVSTRIFFMPSLKLYHPSSNQVDCNCQYLKNAA